MPAVVILRIKDPGPRSAELLKQIESGSACSRSRRPPATCRWRSTTSIPGPAYEAVKDVLDRADPAWGEHLELRA